MKAQREALERAAPPEIQASVGDLLGDLVRQSGDLVKDEIALLKAELRDEVRHYRWGTIATATGVVFGLLAAMALLAAGIVALATVTGLVVSGLAFGGALTVIAVVLILLGQSSFKRRSS